MTAALRFYRDTLGLAPGPVVPIPPDRVNIAFLPVGEVKIELVEPTDGTTGVARFLETRGEGFHHVCFEVADIAATLTRLAIDGIELIDTAPRKGAEGPVAFLHPRSCHGVLVELIERPAGRPGPRSIRRGSGRPARRRRSTAATRLCLGEEEQVEIAPEGPGGGEGARQPSLRCCGLGSCTWASIGP